MGHCVDKERTKILHFGIFFLFRFPGYEMWTPICFLLAVIVLSTMYIFVWLCNFEMKIYKMGHCVDKEKKNNSTFWYFCPFQVSWVRNVDSHMLFIGRDRFVHDDRYELISSRHGRWTLKLKYVGARDAGRFECQVSTVPKLNQTFSLKVVGKFIF